MFITPYGKEEIQTLAAKLNCKVGEIEGTKEFPRFRVALAGNTFGIKEQLKAAGFKFCGNNKVWFVAGYDQMTSFLQSF